MGGIINRRGAAMREPGGVNRGRIKLCTILHLISLLDNDIIKMTRGGHVETRSPFSVGVPLPGAS